MSEASIHITRWGHSGPRVLLIHGGAQGGQVGGHHHFSTQERLAGRGWRLLVPDRPGHGRSPSRDLPEDAETEGAWVADLMEDGDHLVGHSFGGCIALAAAARRPSAVRSLTLIEPGMLDLARRDGHVKRLLLRLVLALVFSTPANRALRFARLMHIPPELRGGASREELQRLGRGIARLKPPSRESLQRGLEVVRRERIPLLVVTGGWSPAFEATGDAVAALGGGQRRVIASEHHFPQLISDAFNDVLEAFMKQSDARR